MVGLPQYERTKNLTKIRCTQIFNGTPAPADIEKQNITSKAGSLSGGPGSYTYHWSKQEPFTTEGGTVKILDPTTFPVASMFSSALVTLQPGAMREIHWHSTSDEYVFSSILSIHPFSSLATRDENAATGN